MFTKRNLFLYSALFVTLLLTLLSNRKEQSQEIAEPTRVLNTAQNNTNTLMDNNTLLILKSRKIPSSSENLFSTPTVETFTQSVNSTPKPTPAMAPELPFKYLGRMSVGAGIGVMLDVQGEVTAIQEGDVLLGQYKVKTIIQNAGILQIQFLYLPLNQIQTLSAQTGN